MNGQPTISLYPSSSYSFGTKPSTKSDEVEVSEMKNFENLLLSKFEESGLLTRTTVSAIMLFHEHEHPFILILRGNNTFALPGIMVNPGQDEVDALRSYLKAKLDPPSASGASSAGVPSKPAAASATTETGMPAAEEEHGGGEDLGAGFEVGELVGTLYRPNFESEVYPYLPPHIKRPKEIKKMYIVHLPEEKVMTVPENCRLLAIPLFELYDNAARYGPLLASIPQLLSRFQFLYL